MRVLVCDERRDVRSRVAAPLSQHSDVMVETFGDERRIAERQASYKADVVVIGTQRARTGAQEAVAELRRARTDVVILVLVAADDLPTIRAVLAAGATAIVPWPAIADASTIAALLTEPTPVAEPTGRAAELTDRERQVLRGLAAGMTNEQIAAELFLSADTVKTHLRRAYKRIGARDRAHAVHLGYQFGVLTLNDTTEGLTR